MVTPAPPLSRVSFEVAGLPWVSEFVKLELISNEMEPIVKPAGPESFVTARLPVALLSNDTDAPTAFGTELVSQLPGTAQLPPVGSNQRSAWADGVLHATTAAIPTARHRPTLGTRRRAIIRGNVSFLMR